MIPQYGDKETWQKHSQQYELAWWKKAWTLNENRNQEFIDKMKVAFNFNEESFANKTVIDIGAGPRSWPSLLLKKAKIIIVEPLANNFCLFNEKYYSLPNIISVHSCPAELQIDSLINTAGMIWCFNVLNHCYEWKKVMDNIQAYLKIGGECYMKVKTSETPHEGHVGVNHHEFLSYLKESNLEGEIYRDNDELTEECYLVKGKKHDN